MDETTIPDLHQLSCYLRILLWITANIRKRKQYTPGTHATCTEIIKRSVF